jgi:hypothetical protein
VMGNDQCAVYDQGFYNISVLPTPEDLGVGGRDPFDAPLSETCRRINSQSCPTINAADPRALPAVPGPAPTCENTTRAAVAGAFKTPGLRNAELTGPYFHTGGKATLKQVVDFYNRGGDFPHENRNDIDPDIEPLGLSESEKTDLVNFLIALTDERVRFEREPFDHPQLCIPDGHVGDENQVKEFPPGYARDDPRCVAEVGKNGRPAPLGTFLDLDPQSRTK